MYVASEYFETANFSQLLSFKGADGPGPLPTNLYPEPLGVHYFGDFLIPFRLTQQPSPYLADGILPFSYLPLSSVLLAPVIFFSYWPAFAIFLLVTLGALIFVVVRMTRFLEGRVTTEVLISIVFLSGPMLSTIDRGNLSLAVTSVCVFAVFELRRGRPTMSAMLFGLAGAMKAYPLVFLVVFVRRRDWKSLSTGLSSFIIATLVPLVMFEGGLKRNLQAMVDQFIASGTTVHASKIRAYNNSFFALFDSLGIAGEGFRERYTIIFGLVALCMIVFAVAKCATDFEALLISTVVMVFSPQTVGQYVLLLFLVPIMWLVSDEQTAAWETHAAAVLLGVLMVPKGLPITGPQADWSPASATFTSVINPTIGLTLLVLCAVSILRRRLGDQKKNTEAAAITNTRSDS